VSLPPTRFLPRWNATATPFDARKNSRIDARKNSGSMRAKAAD